MQHPSSFVQEILTRRSWKTATRSSSPRARLAQLIVLCVFGVVPIAAQAQGESDAAERKVAFTIPSQRADLALTEFAEQADLTMVFPDDLVRAHTANALIGEYTLQEGIDILLAGTGLIPTFSNEVLLSISTDDLSAGKGDSMDTKKKAGFVAILAGALAGGVEAQELEATTEAEEQEEVLEQIIVTGSQIRGAQSASPIVTIDRAEIDMAGFATVEDVVENLPQNFSAGASLDATNSTNKFQAVGGETQDFGGGTAVNLRGLGAGSTLVLLNGRRMSASGFQSRFTSISSIPVSAIERVEVLTDGASAIYGSDAIAGVVNFVLRESYDGAETRVRYGSDVRGSMADVQIGQSFGTSWDSGNVLLTYEYYDRDALAAADRTFTASNDLSPFGGTDWRQPGGNPANIVAGGQTYAIPAGQNGTALTPADFVGLETTQNFHNAHSQFDTTPDSERHSAFLHLRQTVGSVDLFGTARFSSERSETRTGQNLINITVTGDDPATPGVVEGNPFFVDPTGTGLTSVTVQNYAPADDFGSSLGFREIDSSGTTFGAEFSFSDNWQAELVGNWSKEKSSIFVGNEIDTAALTAAVNQTDPDLAFNPFGDGTSTSPDILESLVAPRRFAGLSENEMWSVSLNVDGDVFDVGGGAAKVAMGVDFRDESLFNRDANDLTTDLNRDVLAVYGELFVPFVSSANSRKGLQRLEVSLAARYENYSDFGVNTSPKLGFVWAPTKTLAFRGTIGTSYRAPALVDLEATGTRLRYFPGFLLGLPDSILTLSGTNSGLDAEEATTWTAGFQWSGRNLSLDLTYFDVDFTGRVERPLFSPNLAVGNPRFASITIDNPTSDQIAVIANDPNYEPDWLSILGLAFPAEDLISGAIPVRAIVDNRLTNLAESAVTGTELQLSYRFDTDIGSFNIGLNGSYLFDFERRLLEVDPIVDEIDQIGRPVDFRARGNLAWNLDRWVVSGFVNYTDGYTDNVSIPARAVDSWTTVDLTIGYTTGSNAGILSNTRLSLTARNLFNEDPPFVDTRGGVGYDATNASPLGQFFSLQINKDW